MKKFLFFPLFFAVCAISFWSIPNTSSAAPRDRYAGHIVVQTEAHGEAWYVHPVKKRRYYLGHGRRTLKVLRSGAIGVDDSVLAKIPRAKDTWDAHKATYNTYKGRVLLEVESGGRAWYVHPTNGKRYKIDTPQAADRLLHRVGVSIKTAKLNRITRGSNRVRYMRYTDTLLTTQRGTFRVKIISFPRAKTDLKTISANSVDCFVGCGAHSLKTYVQNNEAIAGINGTYFCSDCGVASYSYFSPLFNSSLGSMMNAYKLPHHNGPLLVVTRDGKYYYYHRSIDFGWNMEEFEERTGKTVAAAIANYPSLVEFGEVVVGDEELEWSMNTHRLRAGVGYTDDRIYFVTVDTATVEELAYVMKKIGAKYAMNLDGGTSTALFGAGLYKVGPGRLLPNALLIE